MSTQWTDAEGDGYDIFATELNWSTGDTSGYWITNSSIPKPSSGTWIAYQNNGVTIQENSHTPQKALGYILPQTRQRGKAPRLAVATHFLAEDDTCSPCFRISVPGARNTRGR